jgi:magnesium transporter
VHAILRIAAQLHRRCVMLGSLLQPEIAEMVRSQRWAELRKILSEMDAPDIAEMIEDLPGEREDCALFRLLAREQAGRVFSYLNLEHQKMLLRSLTNDQMRSVLAEMTPDDQARLLDELPAEVTRQLLDALSPDELRAARDLLGYPPGTAGRYMTPNYVALRPDITARAAMQQVKRTGRGKETLNVLYIVDPDGKLLEDLRLGSLVLADDDIAVADIEDRPLVSIQASASADDVVAAFEKYDRIALPERLPARSRARTCPSPPTARCSGSSQPTTCSRSPSAKPREKSRSSAVRRHSMRPISKSDSGRWCASAAAGWLRSSSAKH